MDTSIEKMRPLDGYVLVEPVEAEEMIGGVYVPPTSQEAPQMGVVLSVSGGYRSEQGTYFPCPVEVGQSVYFKRNWDSEIKVGDKTLQIVKYSDLTVVVDGE